MSGNRWPKRILKWTPPERMKRGRPRRSWEEGIDEVSDLTEEMILDRSVWISGTERRPRL